AGLPADRARSAGLRRPVAGRRRARNAHQAELGQPVVRRERRARHPEGQPAAGASGWERRLDHPLRCARDAVIRRSSGSLAWLLLALLPFAAAAQERMGPTITPGLNDKLYRAAVQHFAAKGGSAQGLAGAVDQSLREGLDFSGLFTRVDEHAFLE